MTVFNRAALPWFCAAALSLTLLGPAGRHLRSQSLLAMADADAASAASTADASKPEPLPPIADEPKSIDSATLVDPKLRQSATITFDETSLNEVAAWLQTQTGFNVTLDTRSLDEAGIDPSSPVTDKLQNSAIYLLLDRLQRYRIGWRLSGGVLQLHAHNDMMVLHNMQYNVGNLLDQKFEPNSLTKTLINCIGGGSGWSENGGRGDLVFLGDVLFIQQDGRAHRRIAGLFAALGSPARRVLIDDPAPHGPMREALDRPTTVSFKAKPLAAAIDEMAKSAAIDMRVDRLSIRSTKITERTPVTFELRDQSLRTTLDLMLGQLKLSWILSDGVLWIIPVENAESFLKTAVYDVRDLCPDNKSSLALSNAIQRQAETRSWDDAGGIGSITFAKPGVMVVMQTERGLDSIQRLLDNYRVALQNSKRRISPDEDPEVVELKYYRMPTEVAADLEKTLPVLLHPESWKSEKAPNAVGTIRRVRSWSEAGSVGGADGESDRLPAMTSYSVLLIEQRRKNHQEIRKILHKIEFGDADPDMHGGGFGGGGGFF